MYKVELLRYIANLIEDGKEEWWEEFEWTPDTNEKRWFVCTNDIQPVTAVLGGRLRRRPRTIKVSGEVSEEAIQTARFLASKGESGTWKYSDVEMVA